MFFCFSQKQLHCFANINIHTLSQNNQPQMHSPSLCSSSEAVSALWGQRPCCDIVKRPTKPASVRKANASSNFTKNLKSR